MTRFRAACRPVCVRTPGEIDPFGRELLACAACGARSHQPVLLRTVWGAPPDLDGRPAGAAGRHLLRAVQRCPECGHCARDLEQGKHALLARIRDRVYQARLNESRCPPLARAWRCSALLERSDRRFAEAGWSSLHAAWLCDDAAATAAADECRMEALDSFLRCAGAGDGFAEGRVHQELVLVDLLRRTGQFEEAAERAARALARFDDRGAVRRILRYEIDLAHRRDRNRHPLPASAEGP